MKKFVESRGLLIPFLSKIATQGGLRVVIGDRRGGFFVRWKSRESATGEMLRRSKAQ